MRSMQLELSTALPVLRVGLSGGIKALLTKFAVEKTGNILVAKRIE